MQFVDDIVARRQEEYADVLAAETRRLTNVPEVVAVYSTGMVKAPGISDLDVIVVLDLEPNVRSVPLRVKRALLANSDTYLRTHGFFVVSPAHFQSVRWMGDWSTLEHVAGDALTVDSIPQEYGDVLRAAVLLEIGVHKFLALRQLTIRPLRSRELLLTLNSIGYSLYLAQTIGGGDSLRADLIDNYRSRLADTRGRWFELTRDEQGHRLEQCIQEGPMLLLDALRNGSGWLVEALGLSPCSGAGQGAVAIPPGGLAKLDLASPEGNLPVWDPENGGFTAWREATRNDRPVKLDAPVGVAIPYAYYLDQLAAAPSRLAHLQSIARLDKSLHRWCVSSKSTAADALRKRTELLNAHAQWYRPLRPYAKACSGSALHLTGRPGRLGKVWHRCEKKLLSCLS